MADSKAGMVTITDYAENRLHPLGVYKKLQDNLQQALKVEFKAYPNMTVEIGMSTKYQTPRIIINNEGTIPEEIGSISDEIHFALEELGMRGSDEEKEGYYIIDID